jgi:hypothetical protein
MFYIMSRLLPDVWFFADVRTEAEWEKESRIWKRIENAKARLERVWDGKWENHAKTVSQIIEREIFEKVKKWKKLNERKQLKAAWYLLYALEKWPSPYFRSLASYAWEWIWIRALLWEDDYRKWQLRVTQIKEELKKDPTNQTLRDKLVVSEIFYIKDDPKTAKKYSARFGPTIEWLMVSVVWDLWKAKNAYEWEANKWNFNSIQDWLKSYILNNRPANSLW